MRVSSYRSNNRLTLKFGFSQRESSLVFGDSHTVAGGYATLYGSWQEGLVFRPKETDPNAGTEREGPSFKIQSKRKTGKSLYLQVAASRVEGAPSEPFRPFDSEHVMGGENDELMIFSMDKLDLSKAGVSRVKNYPQPEATKSQRNFNASVTESRIEQPVVRAITIINIFLDENPDIFVRTSDGKTHKAIELVKQEFVKFQT